jgi:4-amino-4-deoxy-L-arabinose transferase-like glycosyltransferase
MEKIMPVTTSSDVRRRQRVYLLLIVVAALLFRVALVSIPRVIRWDEPDYLRAGKNLWMGKGYTIMDIPELHYTPLLPVLAGGVYALTGAPELGTAFWYVLLGGILPLFVFLLARRLYGFRVALLGAALSAFFPALSSSIIYWGTMTEPLFLVLIYGALLATMAALDKDGPGWYALVGGLLGLAYLARPEGVVWVGALGLFLLLVRLLRRRLFRWSTLFRLGIYVAAFLLVASPYLAFLHRHTGRWMTTGKLGITYDIGEAVLEREPVLYDKVTASLDAKTGELLWWSDQRFEKGLVDIFWEDPGAFLRRMWRNARRMKGAVLSPTIFPTFLLGLVALGWFKRPWSQRRLLREAVLWMGAVPTLAFLPFHIEVRFFAPAFPALVIWTASGLWALGDWLAETVRNWRFGRDAAEGGSVVQSLPAAMSWILLGILSLYLAFAHVQIIEQGMADMPYAHEAAGLWLKEHASADAAIMTRDLAIPLYAERRFVASPRADYVSFMRYARRKGATHLVVDEREVRVLRPHLAFLLDAANPPPELERVFGVIDERGHTIVYRIKR